VTTPLPDKCAEQCAAEEELLSRLVRLNAERVGEEARGLVRWLQPELQNPRGARPAAATQEEIETEAPSDAPRPLFDIARPAGRRCRRRSVGQSSDTAAQPRQHVVDEAAHVARQQPRLRVDDVNRRRRRA
jgi:hypothetical protein